MKQPGTLKWLLAMLYCSTCWVACTKDIEVSSEPAKNGSFSEEFDTLYSAFTRGWRLVNRSSPIGPGEWKEGSGEFNAYTSHATNQGYAYVNYESIGADTGTISNWLVSPITYLQNGDTITFYTRSLQIRIGSDYTDYTNRLQVRINHNTDINPGHGTDPGDFTTLLLDINPKYEQYYKSDFDAGIPEALMAYPPNWTRFQAIVSGLDAPLNARFAFRYFLEGGGTQGRGTGVAIDHVVFSSKK